MPIIADLSNLPLRRRLDALLALAGFRSWAEFSRKIDMNDSMVRHILSGTGESYSVEQHDRIAHALGCGSWAVIVGLDGTAKKTVDK